MKPATGVSIKEEPASQGFSTKLIASVYVEAPPELLFAKVTDIRRNDFAYPDIEFRFDGTYPIKTGDIYYTRSRGKHQWSTYCFIAVEENKRMSGELVANGGIFAKMRYDHRFIPEGTGTISQEIFEYKLSYRLLGSLANRVYGKTKAKRILIAAHQSLKEAIEKEMQKKRKQCTSDLTMNKKSTYTHCSQQLGRELHRDSKPGEAMLPPQQTVMVKTNHGVKTQDEEPCTTRRYFCCTS